LHSYVRFAAAAALIAFGGIIGAGAIVLVPAAIERVPAIRAEGPPVRSANPTAVGAQLPGGDSFAAAAAGKRAA
jgi:hypothetical protein